MFSKQYIKKCIKAQFEIKRFRTFNCVEAIFSFEVEDYFYHPEMEEGKVKEVIKKEEVFLYVSDL